MAKRTPKFQFTLGPDYLTDPRYLELKAKVRAANEVTKCFNHEFMDHFTTYRINVMARLGKDNPHAHLYKGRQVHSIKIAHGQHFDVYVAERRTETPYARRKRQVNSIKYDAIHRFAH